MLVIILVLVSANLVINNLIASFIDQQDTQNTIRWSKDFESLLEPNFVYYNYMNLVSQVEEILREKQEDFVRLFDSNRKEIIHRGVHPDTVESDSLQATLGTRKIRFNDLDYILVSIPVQSQGSNTVWGYILYGKALRERAKLIAKIRLSLLYLSIGLFLISGFVLRFIIKLATKPVGELTKGLEMISYGNLAYRIQIDSGDEFSYMADRFNEMGAKLETIMQEIENTQKDLETQIIERTKTLDETNKKLKGAMEELKNTQKKIIQSEKQKSLTAIVSGFAHEINNPLTGILGYVDLMELRDDVSPYIKDKLSYIKNQSNRIKDIITELNQLNPEVDQTKLEINLTNLIDKLIKILSTKKENQDIEFNPRFHDSDTIIIGNHFFLWQVFEGILENSIEAIHERRIEDGKISITLKKSADHSRAIVEILDNGGGFQNIDKAFDPFYTTKSRTQKKGIGLSISYNLIQEHAGSIMISNTETGALVTVLLPLAQRDTAGDLAKSKE
jgi:nitrogen fixation/metabolism regulation signal transduction histidine kinase